MRVARAINGLPGGINVAIPAHDGTVLLGTNSGLYRFMYPFRLEYWNHDDGVDSPYFIMRTGSRVFASGSGIKLLGPARTRWEPWVEPAEVGTAVHLVPGPDQSVFAASLMRGVTQISAGGKVLARSNNTLGGARLANDNHGQTWLAGTGVTRVTRKGSRLDTTPAPGALQGTSLDMGFDARRGALWACLDRKVVRLANDRWTQITQKDGLLDDDCRSVAVLPNGDVWIAYSQLADLSRIRLEQPDIVKVDNYKTDNKTHDGDHIFLDADSRGWLWMASNNADYLTTEPEAAQGKWLRLDAQDGIPSPGGNQNSFFSDTDGSVWFASENTVVHFTPPDDFATHFPPPPVFIAGFSFGQHIATLADAIGLVPRNTDVVAHIGSLQFDRRNSLRIRYRLLPDEAIWNETSNLNPHLGKLRWGHHALQVQAQLATGPWSVVAEQSLTVPLPEWLSWPSLLLLGIGGAGIGLGARHWRRRQQFKRKLTLPDLSAWRMGALSPDTEHLVGTTIDERYEIGHILAVGGFATVARARDLAENGKLCAVKIFRYELADQDWVRHRFEQEVTALERLSHPNIVKITGHGTVDTGAPYLVMEFIQGRNLRELLGEGALPRTQIASFLRQITSALAALHGSAIYHRDLKPENLMIRFGADNEEEIVLIDFSIAIVKSPDQTFHGISRVAGTLDYMAPEQVIGFADASTDIYSLAKVVIEMLTGMRWTELLPTATLDLPVQIREYFAKNPGIFQPDSIEMIVSALAFDPARRPKKVEEFAGPIIRDLEQVFRTTNAEEGDE
jgi:tRNA A-37 threonylcarbamoyl transferase component Bud32